MRWVFFFLLIFSISSAHAQHCPWDCSGLVILDWPNDKYFRRYQVRLVDGSYKQVYNHNVYQSSPSIFEKYELLKRELTEKVANIYEYDTMYHFAIGSYVTRYNYCDYPDELFVEVSSKKTPDKKHYFPLDKYQKFHLHERADWEGKTPETFDPKFKVKIRF